jgi:hypothetical protein
MNREGKMDILNKNEEGPLSVLMKAMSGNPLVSFSRISFQDIPAIAKFLMSVWPQYYGKVGCPVFKEDYLQWLFGGPNQGKHLLLCARVDDEIVAYQSLLFRRVSCSGRLLNAFLGTHVAISPHLDFRSRIACCLQQPPYSKDSEFFDPACDIIIEMFEERKKLRDVGTPYVKKYFGIDRKICSLFNHFIVDPAKLNSFVKNSTWSTDTFRVRTALEADSAQLTELFNRVPQEPHFIVLMTEDELKYHLFSHPAHRTFVIEGEGTIKAFLNCYPLDFMKGAKISTYILIEFLIAEPANRTHVAMLLKEVLCYAEEIRARYVVMENATYLDYDAYAPLGLVPTFRRMTMSVLAKNNDFDYVGNFRCDVK